MILSPTGKRVLSATGKVALTCDCCGPPPPLPPCDCVLVASGGTNMPSYCVTCQPFTLRVTLSGFDAVCNAFPASPSSDHTFFDGSHDAGATPSPPIRAGGLDGGWKATAIPVTTHRYPGNSCAGGTFSTLTGSFEIEATVRGTTFQIIISANSGAGRFYTGTTPWIDCTVGRAYTFAPGVYQSFSGVNYSRNTGGDYDGCGVTAVICPEGPA